MADRPLNVAVRTPHETVFEAPVHSLRVPTETGQVGLRPSVEGHVLAFDAGVANVRLPNASLRFIGTAGGLLLCDGESAILLTPLAVVGENEQEIATELERAVAIPSAEMEARSMLSRLEGDIVNELQRDRLEHVRGLEVR